MQSYKKRTIILIACLIATPPIVSGFFCRWGKKTDNPYLNHDLADAIRDRNYFKALDLLVAGANPNYALMHAAPPHKRVPLLVYAFEQALLRDEDGTIIGIHQHASDIARQLVNYKAKFDDLKLHLEEYIDDTQDAPDLATAKFKSDDFKDAHVLDEFTTFVHHLKAISDDPIGEVRAE